MPLFDSSDPRPVHFVGITGAGMNALAALFARRGVVVTGCDANPSGVEDLERLGVRVIAGHDPAHVEDARAIVVTSAVPKTHPELERARALGIPVVRRAEALGEVTRGRGLVGISGTHGKTTTTVMTTEALVAAGRDPTGYVGGRVAAWEGNLRLGSDQLFVVESDEYDRSFLTLEPTVAVVTNVEADHLDIYRDLDDITETFAEFARRGRHIVLCADDAGANALPTPSTAEVIRYGIRSDDARLRARELRLEPSGARFVAEFDGEALGEVVLRVPGAHNVLNALAALASGLALGATVPQLAEGLARFGGVERRFQLLGEVGGVIVIDDYAHHPTEVEATISAARAAYPERRLVAAFQPHLFTRTRDFAPEFGRALAVADALFLLEIYPSREQPIDGVTADLVVDAVGRAGGAVTWRGGREGLADALAAGAREGDLVVLMGAGDITRTGPELLERLAVAHPRPVMDEPAQVPPPRRRRAPVLAALALLVAALASAPWWGPPALGQLSFFRVRRVEIRGARYIPPGDILRRLAVDTTASVWSPTAPLRARVATHPEVRSARVLRRLPGTLVVVVEERVPVALVPAADGFHAYDERGVALALDLTRTPVDAPILRQRDPALLRLLARIRADEPALYHRVSEVRRLGAEDVLFKFDTLNVRALPDVAPARLREVEPVERDLARRGLRAAELDLRFRDQVIARVQ